ncbi:hypothetical protein BDB01DRAFT_887379 [Pilobolus umbonatus]|nr:hypothetical protein BDB01DRAFT_887379 [Pilobolus umbonatus]
MTIAAHERLAISSISYIVDLPTDCELTPIVLDDQGLSQWKIVLGLLKPIKRQLHARIMKAKDTKEFKTLGVIFNGFDKELYNTYNFYDIEMLKLLTSIHLCNNMEEAIENLLSFKVNIEIIDGYDCIGHCSVLTIHRHICIANLQIKFVVELEQSSEEEECFEDIPSFTNTNRKERKSKRGVKEVTKRWEILREVFEKGQAANAKKEKDEKKKRFLENEERHVAFELKKRKLR